MKSEIVPTVVPQLLADVAAARTRYAFAPALHIDITDGVFAPHTTWTPQPGERLPDTATVAYEAHLMVERPLQRGLSFARMGVRRIIGHVEVFDNAEQAREVFEMWRTAGVRDIGIGVLLNTPLEDITPYLELCDFVHLMTIAQIGKQGFSFDEGSLKRVATLHAAHPDMPISVDGGETVEVVDDLARAGATRFCIGSALATAESPAHEYAQLQAAINV